MGKYLIDTNAVSDYLSFSFGNAGMSILDDAVNAVPNLSIITQIELLCWDTDKVTQKYIKDFIADSSVLGITPEVIEQCVKIRKGRKIKTPDAIIAATALTYGYTIITSNEKDFSNIKGLKILNPYKI